MDKKFFNRPQRVEVEPDTSNVHFMDEYPRLSERLRLRRLAQPAVRTTMIYHLPHSDQHFDDLRSLMEEAPQESHRLPDDSA